MLKKKHEISIIFCNNLFENVELTISSINLLYPNQSYNICFKFMEITILGCGSSLGCPVIKCKCLVCTSENSYNKRQRSSIVIKKNNKTILVDFGPDIKNQLVCNNIENIDAVICTHAHYDHIAGLTDLKVYSFEENKKLNLYSEKITLDFLTLSNPHIFSSDSKVDFIKNEIEPYHIYEIADINISFFNQIHGLSTSLGFRIGNFVYSNDLTDFPKISKSYLNNIDIWVLDCIGPKKTKGHCGLDEVLFWREQFKPKKIYLTNLSHEIDYFEFQKKLPANIKLCHDNLKLDITTIF
jgi:phosphoribosyl 1,2-cyclic phosphate phosphodiesterase